MWHAKDMLNIKTKSLYKLVAESSLLQVFKFQNPELPLIPHCHALQKHHIEGSVLDTCNPSTQEAQVLRLVNSSFSGLQGQALPSKERVGMKLQLDSLET